MQGYPKDYKISRLIAKEQMNLISPEEEEKLRAWLEEDVRNRILYERIVCGEKKQDREKYVKSLDVEESWNSVKKQMNRTARKHVWSVGRMSIAASVLLILGTVLYFLMLKDHSVQVAKPMTVVTSGSSKAVLITGGGKSIELDDSIVRQIQVGDGLIAINDSGKVSYQRNQNKKTSEKMEYNTIRVPRGGEYKLLLSDNTKVYLNADSEIRFPVEFGKGKREVFLQGEAYFEVARDTERPFVVNACDKVSVEVLGTQFNVQAYSDEEVVETTLNEGCVRVYDKKQSVELRPDQQAVYSKENGNLTIREVDADSYSAWKDGRLVLRNITLEEIMLRLGRWYNISVFWVDPRVKEYHFSGELARYGNFEEILQMLEKATRVRFEVKDRTVFVYKNDI